MEINSYLIKLTGKAHLPEPLELSNNFKVTISGAITQQTDIDNDDNTFDRVYTFRPIIVETCDHLGKRLKAKDTRRESQKTRGVAYKTWEVNPTYPTDFDEVWTALNKQIRLEMPELLDRALNHENQ